MSSHFRFFNYAEAVSNGRPINIYFYTIRLQNGVSCLYKMIYKTIVQRLTLLFMIGVNQTYIIVQFLCVFIAQLA